MDLKDMQRKALSKQAEREIARNQRYFMAERPAFAAHSMRSRAAMAQFASYDCSADNR